MKAENGNVSVLYKIYILFWKTFLGLDRLNIIILIVPFILLYFEWEFCLKQKEIIN